MQQPKTVPKAENKLKDGGCDQLGHSWFPGDDAGSIDECVGKNAGENAAAGKENDGVAKADRGCVYKLQQGF